MEGESIRRSRLNLSSSAPEDSWSSSVPWGPTHQPFLCDSLLIYPRPLTLQNHTFPPPVRVTFLLVLCLGISKLVCRPHLKCPFVTSLGTAGPPCQPGTTFSVPVHFIYLVVFPFPHCLPVRMQAPCGQDLLVPLTAVSLACCRPQSGPCLLT